MGNSPHRADPCYPIYGPAPFKTPLVSGLWLRCRHWHRISNGTPSSLTGSSPSQITFRRSELTTGRRAPGMKSCAPSTTPLT